MSDGETISFVCAPSQDQSYDLNLGQQVTLDVLPSDVMLNPPRWVSHYEDNQWPARVVLAAYHGFESLVVVKILGRFWTFTSTRHTSRLCRPPRAWDRVTVHIPLDAIHPAPLIPAILIDACGFSRKSPPKEAAAPVPGTMVNGNGSSALSS